MNKFKESPGNEYSRKRLISSKMTVLDTVATWKETQAVFKRYDSLAGECICCNALFEPIQDMVKKYGLDLMTLLADLEAAAAQKT
ncbi:MAG: hypothetical protein QM498_05630 [Desulfobacterium sp.]